LADCEKLNQVVYDTVVGILDDQQRARFDEILLQQYLATNTHLALYQLERVGYEVDRKEKKYVERATDQQMCFDTIDTLRLYRQIPVVAELLRRHTDAKGREKIDGMLQKIYVPYGGSRIFEDMPFLEQARGDSETKKSNRRRDK
jgi:hypothetical protein